MKEFFEALKIKIKKSLDSVILIVPNNGTSIKRFQSNKMLVLILVYTSLLFIAGFYSGIIFKPEESSLMSETDINRINALNEKVLNLTGEIEELRTSNRRLKSAIFMADSTAFKDNEISAKKKKLPKEGSIFSIFQKIMQNLNEFQQESYYFIKPAEGFISRGFNTVKGHFGIDIVLKTGNAVYSAGNGYVVFADYTPEDGYIIIVNHSDDYVTVYKHCSSLLKKQRDYILQGEIIALSGNTGISSGPHLHFEIWKKGVPQDPKDLLIN